MDMLKQESPEEKLKSISAAQCARLHDGTALVAGKSGLTALGHFNFFITFVCRSSTMVDEWGVHCVASWFLELPV
jgi:hypothetical protein